MTSEQCSFTSHVCWGWVVQEAVERLSPSSPPAKCASYRSLPSVAQLSKAAARSRAGYALWRVELRGSVAWCTSTCLEHLDAKDALLTALQEDEHARHCMPPTLLLAWNDEDAVATEAFISTHGTVMLKAALGAGGFGLYLVSTARDCHAVMAAHAAKARATEGFLAKILLDYGSVPRWSLQAKLSPVLVAGRKSQARAYVCCLEQGVAPKQEQDSKYQTSDVKGLLFIYETLEIRLPLWRSSWSEANGEQEQESPAVKLGPHEKEMYDYEEEICAGCEARAYNSGRIKRDTERLLLTECPDLQHGAQEAVMFCLEAALGALRRGILARISDPCPGRLAVAGVDLLISRDPITNELVAHILELNNNPAMPDPLKHKMTSLYRQHLVDFCHLQIALGLSGGRGDHTGFVKVP